ncbi:MAG: translation initiation factor IF-2 [Alkalispirochaeta sp.]
MAEDQDKQKPKTTLIKKKAEPSETGEKKKVRVVVKRKPKAKPQATPDTDVEGTDAPTAQTSSPSEKSAPTPSTTSDDSSPRDSAASRTSEATDTTQQTPAQPADTTTDGSGESRETKSAAAPASSQKTPADEGASPSQGPDASAPEEKKPAAAQPAPAKPSDSTEKTGKAGKTPEKPGSDKKAAPAGEAGEEGGGGLAWSVKEPGVRKTPRRPASEARSSITSSVGPRSATRSTPQRGGRPEGRTAPDQAGGQRAGGRTDRPTGPRQGPPARGPGRPPQGNRPDYPPRSPQDRGPAPRGPNSRGPSGPGGGGPGGPPREGKTGAAPKQGGGKKFFKSKRGRGGYDRDERQREKEIQYSRKKPQPRANPVPKEIDIMEVVTVSELAKKLNLKANELIGKLMGMGMMVTINQQIDRETAEILAGEYGCKVNVVSLYDETIIETANDEAGDMRERSPIVTVMGHVDHGKTKLLDAIRTTNVVDGESGGITQHIGAYQVTLEQGTITFLDTPGHEAFTLMRARGAQLTDIVILVVAANDGVMPQTKEAISHAKEAGVPLIVAINKVDLPEANVDRVKQQLSELELIPEEWGGQTAMVEVSALKHEGIEDLLETVLLQSELLELKANFDRNAEGKVIESRIDPGRGTVASVLIERGTINVGDAFVGGIYAGKVRAMFDDRGNRIEQAFPSMPIEILGFDGVPEAGDPFQVTADDKQARQVGTKRQELKRVEEAKNVKKVTLDNLYDSIQEGAIQELKVVIKGDVHGSVEALQSALEKLSTKEIRLIAIHASAGAINEGDIMLASASNAIVVGFHVRPTPRAMQLADREKVDIRKYSVIYDAVEDIRAAMEGMLAPDLQEETVGAVEVRDTFKVPKIGIVAGCYVIEGKVRRNAKVRVFRDNIQIHEGTISSLKRFKDDVREVETGYECGIGISNLQDVQVGDTLEIFVVKEVAKKLNG